MKDNGKAAPIFDGLLDAITTLYGAPLLVLYGLNRRRGIITADVVRWMDVMRLKMGRVRAAAFLLGRYPEFRSLFYYRLGRKWLPIVCFARIFFPPCPSLYFETPEIGPGLFIQHGFSTIIGAKRIGSNCWINQQVTIGWLNGSCPAIGDNVKVFTGAKVLGDITLGDNSQIGVGSVVLNSVPPNCTVFGVPARIVKRSEPASHAQ